MDSRKRARNWKGVMIQGLFFIFCLPLSFPDHMILYPTSHLTHHLTHHLTNHMTSHLTITKTPVSIVCLIGPPYCSPFLLFPYLLFYIIDPHFLVACILGSILSTGTRFVYKPPVFLRVGP